MSTCTAFLLILPKFDMSKAQIPMVPLPSHRLGGGAGGGRKISHIRCCCRAVLSPCRCAGSLLLRDVENLVRKPDEQIPALDKV